MSRRRVREGIKGRGRKKRKLRGFPMASENNSWVFINQFSKSL